MTTTERKAAGHTPGPWTWRWCEVVTNWWYKSFEIRYGNRILAKVNIFAGNPENSQKNDVREGDANARLMALSPELLEACVKAANGLRNLRSRLPTREWEQEWDDLPDCLKALESVEAKVEDRAAIAKAKAQ